MSELPIGFIVVSSHNWTLTRFSIQVLLRKLDSRGMKVEVWESKRPEVRMIVSSLGILAKGEDREQSDMKNQTVLDSVREEIIIHRGTLRSGDTLVAPGTILLLGDVNPGAIISSVGDVMIWGKLRGIAHAGCLGNQKARIVAMHLRPLQLRIAQIVARVPDDKPGMGLAEEAQIFEGNIRITLAYPGWSNRT
ncbi:possible septum site-determining protein (chromatophore) [Paulinella micropora]|uniref:Possible septum site-determining protein n=2 Tax=Paulinella micropora TaxID=1928728 RepID=A0A5K7VVB0_9EUKA|nr:possible septum site-determining protein [Paulinella micropora]